MTYLDHALELAKKGFYVFPLVPNSKLPLIEDFPHMASRDEEQIKKWWLDPVMGYPQPYNIGISTDRFGESEALVVVDVDNKDGKDGDSSLLALELKGQELQPTFTQHTPTGGRHYVFKSQRAIKQSAGKLGEGLDIRSRGGYIVGAGSTIDEISYRADMVLVVDVPKFLSDLETESTKQESRMAKKRKPAADVDQRGARKRAREYLESLPPVTQGGRNHAGFATAAVLKDFGVDEASALDMMIWDWKCEPKLDEEEIRHVVKSAYRYGKSAPGSASPEAAFDDVVLPETIGKTKKLHPFQELNKQFAFVIAGGGSHILWETKGPKGEFRLEHLGIAAFHQKFASATLQLGSSAARPLTELWMKSPDRRSYDGICFMPGLEAPPRFYNLWRGYSFDPLPVGATPSVTASHALNAFLEHARKNVCGGDEAHFNWLMGYFAHLIQRPWEKPLVALVFRGKKGTGKSSLVERVGALIGGHFMATSDKRYLLGNFNGHLENNLLFILEEAFWSGDKQAEGVLKNLITGRQHVIEHKGKEPYTVDNCTRVVIIGNEQWVVPATQDERRFAVFTVGDSRKQDRSFFQKMREGMEAGGYSLLLRYFLDFDLSTVDVNHAPSTVGLMEQKVASLDPIAQWWLDCLAEQHIVGGTWGGGWPEECEKQELRNSYRRYARDRQIRSRIPEDRVFGRELKDMCPSIDGTHRKRDEGELVSTYRLPKIEVARAEWSAYLGGHVKWE